MPRLAVVTSGGDAPGMNAALRAVVRSAAAHGWDVLGIRHGYSGLINGEFVALGVRDVGGIIENGGTVLGTTRCERLKSVQGREAARQALRDSNVSALVVIGGNGSQTGAWELAQSGLSVVGIASTIDNDLYGSDISIGATTASEVALQAIQQLRVTASAMSRAFLVEVMGRHCGYLALMAGIAGGAEVILVPEVELDPEMLASELRDAYLRGKSHAIAVVAEGARYDAESLVSYFHEHRARLGFDMRMTRLGHVQRGGAPGVFDRMLATTLGVAAVEAVVEGRFGVLVGMRAGLPVRTELAEVAGRSRPADLRLLELARRMAM
ncbi:MAG TPA: ATP-dependent 6-phosphofructokinase [Steroidobacteraceae bacterium]|nr:ATP-dependent 6-phosphofructokinase [Steroidobacteraceae bacterium]